MRKWAVSGIFICLMACATPPEESYTPAPSGSIMFLPPVADITLVTAAGLREPRPDWSEAAKINLAQALAAEMSEKDGSWTTIKGQAGQMLAQELSSTHPTNSMPADFSQLPDQTDLVALILVRTDVESSASRMVQSGLVLMFGGMPGPDGIDRSAHLYLFNRESGQQIWDFETEGKDVRSPDAAVSVIDSLLDGLGADSNH